MISQAISLMFKSYVEATMLRHADGTTKFTSASRHRPRKVDEERKR